ncbi:MAG: YrdB family protein [Bacillaceae bacterium]|nr:YrdB family protein [Bacillaceae bacterium]
MLFYNINLAIRFLLELILLAVYSYAGFKVGKSPILHWATGILLPLAVAVVWGLFISPKAPIDIPYILQLSMEVFLFGLAVFLLYVFNYVGLAGSLAVIYFLNRAILLFLEKGM